MPTAQITATIKTPQPGSVKSTVTVTEVLGDGTSLTPTTYELNATTTPPWTAAFTAGLGSTLKAVQVDFNASGVGSSPSIIPDFVVTSPALPAPTGDALAAFAVGAVTP